MADGLAVGICDGTDDGMADGSAVGYADGTDDGE